MWVDLLLNLAVLIALAQVGTLGNRERTADGARARWPRVLVAALSGTALLLVPAHLAPGVQVDLRLVPLALLTFSDGLLWGGLAALPVLAVRVYIGGPGMPLALLNAVVALGLATLLAKLSRRQQAWWHPLVIFAPTPLTLLLLPAGLALFKTAAPALLLTQVFGYLTLASVYNARVGLLKLARDFRRQARTDTLTGLWNRRQFNEDLESLSPGDHLLLLDIDHFKRVNDTLGHDVGDEVLMRVAEVLASTHAPGRVYRLGGEEFALMLRRATPGQAQVAAELCWRAVRTRSYHPTSRLHVTCSVGLTALKEQENSQGLFQRADEALYRAKSGGRDRVVYGLEDDPPTQTQTPTPAAPGTSILQSSKGEAAWHARWKAVLATLELVSADHDLGQSDWERIVQAAVYSVPGGEAGSLMVAQGSTFYMRAQLGYDDALLGTPMSDSALQTWYGGSEQDYHAGLPRVMRGAQIVVNSHQAAETDQADDSVFMSAGRTAEIRSTVCVPVVVEDRVVAHLNIDSFSNAHAFQGPGLEVAREFGVQIGALIRTAQNRRRAAERGHELEALTRVTQALRDARSEDEIVHSLVQEATALLHTDTVVYMYYDRTTDALRTGRRTGHFAGSEDRTVPRGRGLSWQTLQSGQVLHIVDASTDARVRYHPDMRRDALLAAPLKTSRGEEIGVLVVAREAGTPFTAQDEALASGITSLAVTAIERARHLSQLEAGRNGAFQALGLALEVRDFETQGHTERVQALGERFAERLGLDTLRREAMTQGAYLHDIGKLQVPDRILLKPGKLDEVDWQTMRMHAQWGFDIARRVPGIRPEALDLILYHHERWDGVGYPRGLSGAEIPLLARAFSIIDTYDALTHARPYKPAWSFEEALAELRRQAGRQFDPELVEAFVEIAREETAPVRLDAAHIDQGLSLFDMLTGQDEQTAT